MLALPLSARPTADVPARLGALRHDSPVLVASAFVLAALGLVCLVGLAIDPRMLTGAPIWLKPLKFCVSSAVYVLTLAVLMRPLRGRWVARVVDAGVGMILVFEVGVIVVQAVRGVQSHFNIATAFDATLYASMGVAITVLWVLTLVAAIALARTPGADRLGRQAALWGLGIALAGGAIGFLMTQPTPAQIEAMQSARPLVVGAHTVGAPDGGPSVPITGWSTTAGDLRVPHFVGLHGLQAIPLLAYALRRRRVDVRRARRMVHLAALGYLGGLGVLLAQALRGQSLVAPDALTLGFAAGLGVALALGAVLTLRPSFRPSR